MSYNQLELSLNPANLRKPIFLETRKITVVKAFPKCRVLRGVYFLLKTHVVSLRVPPKELRPVEIQ